MKMPNNGYQSKILNRYLIVLLNKINTFVWKRQVLKHSQANTV